MVMQYQGWLQTMNNSDIVCGNKLYTISIAIHINNNIVRLCLPVEICLPH